MTFYERSTTPIGDAFWANLEEPDTYNEDKPKYRIAVRFKDKEACGALLAELTGYLALAIDAHSRGGKKLNVQPLYKDVNDADGNPTGEVEVVFSRDAKKKPAVFDTASQRIQGKIIGNRSKVAVAFRPYDWAYKGKVGVSCWLEAVMLVELVEFEGDANTAEEFGFEGMTKGFEATPSQVAGFVAGDSEEVPF
jgi:hypothetical protein